MHLFEHHPLLPGSLAGVGLAALNFGALLALLLGGGLSTAGGGGAGSPGASVDELATSRGTGGENAWAGEVGVCTVSWCPDYLCPRKVGVTAADRDD